MIAYNTPSGTVDNAMVVEVTLNAVSMTGRVRYRVTVRGGPVEETSRDYPFTAANLNGPTALLAWARAVIAQELGV
jgi:hypothetical protein